MVVPMGKIYTGFVCLYTISNFKGRNLPTVNLKCASLISYGYWGAFRTAVMNGSDIIINSSGAISNDCIGHTRKRQGVEGAGWHAISDANIGRRDHQIYDMREMRFISRIFVGSILCNLFKYYVCYLSLSKETLSTYLCGQISVNTWLNCIFFI